MVKKEKDKDKDKEETPIIEAVDKEEPVPKQRTLLKVPLGINRNEVKRRILEARKKVVR